MSKIIVFNSISLDGYFTDINGDISFAHNPIPDEEWDSFVSSNAGGNGTLIFGRITYEMMASFWPTPQASEIMPVVAERMNKFPKIVFSRKLKQASWNNTRLINENMVEEVRKLKRESQYDLVILGSGSIVAQLTDEHLIDEYQFVITPMILGKGRTMFDGIREKLSLNLINTRKFKNGNVVLYYGLHN